MYAVHSLIHSWIFIPSHLRNIVDDCFYAFLHTFFCVFHFDCLKCLQVIVIAQHQGEQEGDRERERAEKKKFRFGNNNDENSDDNSSWFSVYTNDADDIKRTVSNTEKQNNNETITFERHLTDNQDFIMHSKYKWKRKKSEISSLANAHQHKHKHELDGFYVAPSLEQSSTM